MEKNDDNNNPRQKQGRDSRDMDLVGPIHTAIISLDTASLRRLVSEGVGVKHMIVNVSKRRNCIHELVMAYCDSSWDRHADTKFLDMLEILIQNGVDINQLDSTKNTPLHLMCEHPGHSKAIWTLVSSGARANATNGVQRTPLHIATERGNSGDVETLLESGADPMLFDGLGLSSLHLAAKRRNNINILRSIVGCGVSPDLQMMSENSHGTTPLHVAVHYRFHRNTRALLELGARTDIRDGSGQTALHLAAKHDNTGEAVDLLLRYRASRHVTDTMFGETPLHKAVKAHNAAATQVLLASGADPNRPSLTGDTVVHQAAESCTDISIWLRLFAAGADVRMRNRNKISAMDRAIKAGNKVAATALRQHEHW